MINKILALFWKNTERMDNKRIATLKDPEGVTESVSHAYIDDGHKHHLIDVYYPENAEGKLPVIVDVHGGGWMYGDKELNKNYCLTLASRGYVVFNMSYRLYPEVNAVDQLRDVAAALIWVKDNLDKYPCDKDNIYLTGDSAGGMLAGYTAMLSKSAQMREIFSVPDFSLKFNAVCLTSPVAFMDDGTMISFYTRLMLGKGYKKEKWAPYVNIDSLLSFDDTVPTFLITSSGDALGLKATVKLADIYKEKKQDYELMNWDKFEGKDLPHVFPILYPDSEPARRTIDAMLAFFKKHESIVAE